MCVCLQEWVKTYEVYLFCTCVCAGWVKTYEVYYRTQTKHILDSFVSKLEENPKYKFMFTEMSYFSWWWSDIDDSLRNRVKRLAGLSLLCL